MYVFTYTHKLYKYVKSKQITWMRKYSLNEDLTDQIFGKQDFKITVLLFVWLKNVLFWIFWFIKHSSGKKKTHNNIVEHKGVTTSTE